ncbi:MAG: hypothetical protein HGA44_04415, partial [Cellulomonadaceae bacterium]|nr:hypothetical protein [Cellulomonadaceae bacterium]
MATTSRAARRRTALVAVVTLSLTGLAAPALAASAPAAPVRAESDDTVTITVDADALAALCDERLPQLVTRAEGLIERIQGGADVVGSSAWLTARADYA